MNTEIKSPLINGRVIKQDAKIGEYLDSRGGENGEPLILARGDLCDIYACPHKWHRAAALGVLEPDRPTPSMDFGSLVDCLLLQPAKFNEYYLTAPAEYTNSKKQVVPWTWKSSICREWRDEQEAKGFMVATEEKIAEANAAIAELLNHREQGERTKRLIANSVHQVFVMAEYHDQDTGMVVPVKCLTDIVPNADDPEFGQTLFDLKTAVSAAPKKWCKAVADNNYHVQAAINLDCHNAVAGASERLDFRHLIIENQAPWEPAFRFIGSSGTYEATLDFINAGRMKYLSALKTVLPVREGRPVAFIFAAGHVAAGWLRGGERGTVDV